eukprot:762760-Hanusia_phi.AAC.2
MHWTKCGEPLGKEGVVALEWWRGGGRERTGESGLTPRRSSPPSSCLQDLPGAQAVHRGRRGKFAGQGIELGRSTAMRGGEGRGGGGGQEGWNRRTMMMEWMQ